ncbi:MAG: hypothetical protein HZC36_01485 [Armatimonadetes bacterium]|nr:hypothetical protein [Armatimonadota bacterium]
MDVDFNNDILGNRSWRDFEQTGSWRYNWDALNRATDICGPTSGARYEYRADGMRIEKIEGLTITWVPPENPFFGSGHYDENQAGNNPTTRYFYDGQMAMEEDYNNSSAGHPSGGQSEDV